MSTMKRSAFVAAAMLCLVGTSVDALPDHYWIVGGYWSAMDDEFHTYTDYNRTDMVVMKARYNENEGTYFWNDSSSSELQEITPHTRRADGAFEIGEFKYYLNRTWSTGEFHQVVYLQRSDFVVFEARFFDGSLFSTGMKTSVGTELSFVFDVFEQLDIEGFISEHELDGKIRDLHVILAEYSDDR